MPTMDFPFPATTGDKYPVPAIPNQPVYTFDGVKWTTHGEIVDDIIGASALIPLPDGIASAGAENNWSRGDHVHPALINDLVLTGNPTAPTPPLGDNDTTIATTAFVQSTVTATEIGTSVLVGSAAPVGAADNTLWFEDDTGRLYLFYNDGTGPSQWIAAAPAPNALTSRQSVYAAPFDAMAYSGMQINGGMEVSQERGATGTASGYIVDGWSLYSAGTMGVGASYIASTIIGFPAAIYMSVSTAQTTIGATDQAVIYQNIEGYRIARLAWGTASASPITIGFWSKHHRTGVFSVAIRNGASNRSYVATYIHAVADIAQYNTVTIPGCVDGVWPADNTAGMTVLFSAAMGSTYTAPAANTWYSANYIAAPGQVNGVGSTADIFYITGVTVLPGTEWPSAEKAANIMRPYDQELATCMRYFEKIQSPIEGARGAGVTASHATWTFKVNKRVAGTFIYAGASRFDSVPYQGVDSLTAVCATNSAYIDSGSTIDARL